MHQCPPNNTADISCFEVKFIRSTDLCSLANLFIIAGENIYARLRCGAGGIRLLADHLSNQWQAFGSIYKHF